MRAIKTQKGFTIVETMIVLAVTGFLMMITALLVSGQISRYQFRESSINVEQKLADAINDVRTGYFDIKSSNISANDPNTGTPVSCAQAVVGSPGSSNCLYIGKEYTIDSSQNILSRKTLFINESNLSGLSSGSVVPIAVSGQINDNLPRGLDYNNNATFAVMLTNYSTVASATSTNKGKGQSIEIRVYDAGSNKYIKPSNNIAIKASNGSRKVVYCLGKNGDPTVQKLYDTEVCP